jgi:hypothetical protein
MSTAESWDAAEQQHTRLIGTGCVLLKYRPLPCDDHVYEASKESCKSLSAPYTCVMTMEILATVDVFITSILRIFVNRLLTY